MAWEPYNLDKIAHDLVFARRNNKDLFNQVYKMRTTIAYGLERFWGEKLRLEGEESLYWDETWIKLKDIMEKAGIEVPNHSDINQQVEALWLDSVEGREDRKVILAVLTQLCDCMIWWTQRYKKA
jgi:hypothetical protein